MPQTINIPISKTSTVSVKVTDAAGNDITSTGSTSVASSNTSVATAAYNGVGAYNVKGIASGSSQITWTWSSPSGSIAETDTVNVTTDPPSALVVTYSTPA